MPEQPQPTAEKLHPIHDAFMKLALSRAGALAALLRAAFPAVAAKLADKPFRPLDKRFIDSRLKTTEADILLEGELEGGGSVCILAEHKSTPDPRAPRQIAGYILSLCDMHRKRRRPGVPTIIAVAIYHGEGRFELPERLAQSIAPAPEDLLVCRPLVCNLREIPLEAFREHPLLWGAMAVVLRAKEAVSRGDLAEIFTALKADADLLDAAKAYILIHWHTPRPIVDQAMMDAQLRGGIDMGPLALEMQAKSKAEGKAEILARQMQHHFRCEVPQPLQARLADASTDELDAWAVRIFEAPDLEAVFKN